MEINGKELKMLYSVGADVDLDEELTRVGAQDFASYIQKKGTAKAYIKIAAIMNKWSCIKTGKEDEAITEKEMMTIDAADLQALIEEVLRAFNKGQHRDIETQDSKNAESADR